MKYLIGLLIFISLSITAIVNAASGNCYAIRDNALRQQCLAETQRNSAQCYGILDQDQKNYCLAVTTGNSAYCYSIRDSDKKAFCLAK